MIEREFLSHVYQVLTTWQIEHQHFDNKEVMTGVKQMVSSADATLHSRPLSVPVTEQETFEVTMLMHQYSVYFEEYAPELFSFLKSCFKARDVERKRYYNSIELMKTQARESLDAPIVFDAVKREATISGPCCAFGTDPANSLISSSLQATLPDPASQNMTQAAPEPEQEPLCTKAAPPPAVFIAMLEEIKELEKERKLEEEDEEMIAIGLDEIKQRLEKAKKKREETEVDATTTSTAKPQVQEPEDSVEEHDKRIAYIVHNVNDKTRKAVLKDGRYLPVKETSDEPEDISDDEEAEFVPYTQPTKDEERRAINLLDDDADDVEEEELDEPAPATPVAFRPNKRWSPYSTPYKRPRNNY